VHNGLKVKPMREKWAITEDMWVRIYF